MLVKQTVCFIAFLLVGFIVADPGVAFASKSAIIINEIELNPPGNEPPWVELYNQGTSPASLYNASLLSTGSNMIQNQFNLAVGPTSVIEPDTYYIVYLPQDYFDSKWTALTLVQGEVVLNEVSGFNDGFADDGTWQRFPNAVDNGIFEDWTFKKSTMGKYNGDMGQMIAECYVNPLCLSLDMVVHKMHAIHVNGSSFTVSSFSTSAVARMDLIEEEKKISIRVLGKDSGLAFTYITFPKTLLGGEISTYIDTTNVPFYRTDNETHSRIMLEYSPGDRTIDVIGTSVIPEFSMNAIPLLSAGIISTAILYRKWSRDPKSNGLNDKPVRTI